MTPAVHPPTVRDLSSGPQRLTALLLIVGLMLAAFGLLRMDASARATTVPHMPTPSGIAAISGGLHSLENIAYASSNDHLYVASDWGPVSVINGITNTLEGSLGSFPSPYSVVYDPEANELFVGDQGSYEQNASRSMYVVDLATLGVVQSFPNANPWGTVYDPATHAVYLQVNGSVLVLDAKTNAIKRTYAGLGGFRPQGFDPLRNLLFGVDDTDILAVNLTRGMIVWSTPNTGVGIYPIGYDPLNGDVYLSRLHEGRLTMDVVDGATGATVASIPEVWNVQGYLFDPANGDMYISSNAAYWELVVVNATLNVEVARVDLGAPPGGLAYDPTNRDVYVACTFPTLNRTGVVLVVPSENYPLPNPWPSVAVTLGEMTAVGGVLVAIALVAARVRDRRGPGPGPTRPAKP